MVHEIARGDLCLHIWAGALVDCAAEVCLNVGTRGEDPQNTALEGARGRALQFCRLAQPGLHLVLDLPLLPEVRSLLRALQR
jgi:hypothetical protein